MEPTNSERRRCLGVFGGTFDPPHVGHAVIARDLVAQGDLDTLVWMPARHPPHKPDGPFAGAGARLKMVRAAVEGVAAQDWSDIELAREGPSYMVDTLRLLRDEYSETDLVLIIGVDQFARFSEWKEPEEVARMAQLWILAREGQEPADIDPGVEVDWRPVEVSRVDVSSSEVRRCVREGKRFQHLIPDGVAEIIEREGLYQD